MVRRVGIAVALAALVLLATPATAHATAGDLYAAGTAYRASTYSAHRSYFGPAPDAWVADINANAGDAGRPIYAPESGSVAIATTGWGTGYGNSIVWTSADGREQLHVAHLSNFAKTGVVNGGDLIGHAGSTGNSSGDHMHASRAYDGQPAPLILSGHEIVPTVGLGTQYSSSGPLLANIGIGGVLHGMTYYCPVTVTYSCAGADAGTVTCDLNGSALASGATLSVPGTYCVTVKALAGGVPVTRSATFTIAAPPAHGLEPVFRFYRPLAGTHFYTPSHEERDGVARSLSHLFAYEGVAYWVRPAANTQPLYRFYSRQSGSHFYTASAAERDHVRANLSAVYAYEGETYRVSLTAGQGAGTVYRFFRPSTGTHFYTASAAERDQVRATLGHLYTFEGPAFFIGQ